MKVILFVGIIALAFVCVTYAGESSEEKGKKDDDKGNSGNDEKKSENNDRGDNGNNGVGPCRSKYSNMRAYIAGSSTPLANTTATDINECCRQCNDNTNCNFVQYRDDDKICEQYVANATDILYQQPGCHIGFVPRSSNN